MGGSSGGTTTQIIQPTPAPQPSTADAIREYVNSLPALYEAQMKYAPMEAQQQVDLARQFAIPLAEAYQSAQEAIYPGTSAIQEKLAGQATEGMSGMIPQSQKDQYRSDLLAQLGENAKSGVGADYVSRSLLNQQEDYNRYYQSLGLSLAGRQPLVAAQTPTYTNQMGNYQPGQGLQYTASNYGTYSAANRPIVSQNQGGTPNWIPTMQAIGNVGGSLGSAAILACWVAREIFGSWEHPCVIHARFYITNMAPKWFKEFYIAHGKTIAKFIKNKPTLKAILKPLFVYFALKGGLRHGKTSTLVV